MLLVTRMSSSLYKTSGCRLLENIYAINGPQDNLSSRSYSRICIPDSYKGNVADITHVHVYIRVVAIFPEKISVLADLTEF